MKQELDAQTKEWYSKIGSQVRTLRKKHSSMNYIDFAGEINMDKKTYIKIETGTGEYYTSSLMRVLDYYPDITAEKFFKSVRI